MNAFSYLTAQTPESAVKAVADDGRFLAGGMDLLGEIKNGLLAPKLLVNVKALPGTTTIEPDAERWAIGANVTLATLAAHPELRRALPALAEAADEVGSPQIRNRGTVGGNLAQHSRCWYYRHRDVRCLKKGGRRCFARAGESKYHALFSGSTCLSPLVSNLAIALAALDATVEVQRGRRVQTLSIAEIYQPAWRQARRHHGLDEDDLILRIHVPRRSAQRSAYLQVAEKSAFDWALVSCAASARVDGRRLQQVRLVLGAVAPIPWRSAEAEAALEGKEWSAAVADRAADVLLKDAEPSVPNAYKVPLARALIRRTLARLVA